MATFAKDYVIKVLAPNGTMIFVKVYPTGLLEEIQKSWESKSWQIDWGMVWLCIRQPRMGRYYLAGYIARPDIMPGKMKQPGSGWTRRRALSDARRKLRKS